MPRKSAKKRRTRLPRIRKERRIDVRREEFNRLVEVLNERAEALGTLQRNQETQFQRIAQIQYELDNLKRAVQKRG
jgi:hypothetical protein